MINRIKQYFWGLKLNVKFTFLLICVVLLPIAGFTFYLFYSMEVNSVNEKKGALEYSMNQSYEQILNNVDSINMSTQFCLSDEGLKEYLVSMKQGAEYDVDELISFTNTTVAALERMVNNNPYLYQIRVYVNNPQMQEIMPILFRRDRMMRLDWGNEEEETGWKYNYTDNIFESFRMYQNEKILSLVTPVMDYLYGEIGTLEVAMKMETMFPMLYEEEEGKWNCFVDNQGNAYVREDMEATAEKYLPKVLPYVEPQDTEPVITTAEVDGVLLLIGRMPVKELGGQLIFAHRLQEDMAAIGTLRNLFLLGLVVFLAIMVALVNYVVKKMLAQFYRILSSIREVQKGDLNVRIAEGRNDEMGELGNQINKMMDRIEGLIEENINRELLVKNSEIRALQNQINSHFIYNVLESVKMMAEIDEKYEISDAITSLGKLLRYSMKWGSGNVSVAQEIEYIENYLALINLRFDYEIYLSLNLPDIIMEQEIPKMSLQPIVENAIYHGIEQMAEDTNIYIKGIVEQGDCIIEITDAGRGMSSEQVMQLEEKIAGKAEAGGSSGNGIGLKNVQDRIQMSFGENYGIQIASRLGCYTKIMVRIPLTKRTKEE